MLIRTLRTFLRPYKGLLTAVVILSLIGTMAALYLPSLNASIIDEGVTKGDTAFIWHTGAIMLGVSAIQALGSMTAVYFGAKAAMAFGRDVRGALFHQVHGLLGARAQPVRGAVADHPQHQ